MMPPKTCSQTSRLITAAFGLYPAWWRERYLDEVSRVTEDLLANGRLPSILAANLALGALRARAGARGMPPSYDAWSRRSCALLTLATAPALVAVVVIAALHQNPAVPRGTLFPRTIPYSSAATAIFLVLLFGFLLLTSALVWGYLTLANGIGDPGQKNARRLRVLSRAPKYLALTSFVLYVVSAFLAPHTLISHGGHETWLGGHPMAAHVVRDLSNAALLLAVTSAATLVVQAARRANLSLKTLSKGVAYGTATAVLLWVMTASAAALNALYGVGTARLGGGWVTMFPSGASLALLTATLSLLATISTVGVVLAGRSVRVARHLAS
jgi:hypothetical protein